LGDIHYTFYPFEAKDVLPQHLTLPCSTTKIVEETLAYVSNLQYKTPIYRSEFVTSSKQSSPLERHQLEFHKAPIESVPEGKEIPLTSENKEEVPKILYFGIQETSTASQPPNSTQRNECITCTNNPKVHLPNSCTPRKTPQAANKGLSKKGKFRASTAAEASGSILRHSASRSDGADNGNNGFSDHSSKFGRLAKKGNQERDAAAESDGAEIGNNKFSDRLSKFGQRTKNGNQERDAAAESDGADIGNNRFSDRPSKLGKCTKIGNREGCEACSANEKRHLQGTMTSMVYLFFTQIIVLLFQSQAFQEFIKDFKEWLNSLLDEKDFTTPGQPDDGPPSVTGYPNSSVNVTSPPENSEHSLSPSTFVEITYVPDEPPRFFLNSQIIAKADSPIEQIK
jgi:hypothetical protein